MPNTETPATPKAMKPVKLIVGTDGITKAIASIKNRGAKLDKDIQRAAISAMAHHDEHGDVTLVNRLVDAMPNGSRVNALRQYIEAHGRVKYDEESKAFVNVKKSQKQFDLDGAQSVMWTEFKHNDDGYTPIEDPTKLIQSLIGRLQKDREEVGSKSKVDPDLIESLKSLAPANAAVPAA